MTPEMSQPVPNLGRAYLVTFGELRRGNGQADSPDPDHLEDPEAEERKELVALVVESVILARLDDAEEENAGKDGHPRA